MAAPRKKERNINRIVIGGQKGWQVRITRGSEQFYPYFSDSKFGGELGALAAARSVRNRIEREYPRLTPRQRAERIRAGKRAAQRKPFTT